ncbi:MAG: CoA pyrophosphatase [Mangrovicoccus sp.]
MARPTPSIEDIVKALGHRAQDSSDFDLNPGIRPPAGRKLRPAAVLLAIHQRPDGPHVILTKRSSKLRHHPGQIALPGGKLDESDPDHNFCALREANEEIGLRPDQVRILGHLTCHETVTAFDVRPVVGVVEGDFTPVPEAGEVAEIFEAPLSHLLDLSRYRIEGRRWQGIKRHYFVVPWGPYYIWGATARILRGLAERMPQG